MKNPFDIFEDVNEDWDLKIDPDSDEEYKTAISNYRMLFEKTREAISYLKSLNKGSLAEAERRVVVKDLMSGQKEKSEIERKIQLEIEQLLPEAKKQLGIPSPKTLEETTKLVEDILLAIPPKEFDVLCDYNGLINDTYAHYLRRVAKQAWDIQNKK